MNKCRRNAARKRRQNVDDPVVSRLTRYSPDKAMELIRLIRMAARYDADDLERHEQVQA